MNLRAIARRVALRGRVHGWLTKIRTARRARDSAAYEAQVARSYLQHLSVLGVRIEGATILELGPGDTPGAALVLASHGADVIVADPYLARWDTDFHGAVLRRLLASWPDELPSVRKSLECGTFAVRQVSAPAHRLAAIADQSVDVVLSNAALEHVENIDAVCTELARITKPGGINAHQVDFRDHREFSRPLEFLLDELPLSDDEYRSRFGNRRRCSELCDAFAEAGFDIEVEVNALVDEEYFRRFLPRLRNCRTAYNAWPEHDLKVLGARFVLRKR